jgi:hypothetical protein
MADKPKEFSFPPEDDEVMALWRCMGALSRYYETVRDKVTTDTDRELLKLITDVNALMLCRDQRRRSEKEGWDIEDFWGEVKVDEPTDV